MTKVVINTVYGGFGLSEKAKQYLVIAGADINVFLDSFKNLDEKYQKTTRTNPSLIKCVEELGDEANDKSASLRVVKIPDGVDWYIEEHAGLEWIAERHRTWYR